MELNGLLKVSKMAGIISLNAGLLTQQHIESYAFLCLNLVVYR